MTTMNGAFEPTWESLAHFTIPTWYQDAKFGIFIHWGIFSVPAFDNEWYSRNMYMQSSRAFEHHRQTYGEQTRFGYKDFIPQFRAEKFDPAEWASLFKEAGAKYVVPVAEHHDGFAMYDCALSHWTAARMGPKRDVIGELAAAARAQGLTFGLSSHRAEHWWFMNGGRQFDSDVQDPTYADFYGPAHPGPNFDQPELFDSNDWQPRPDGKFLEDWLRRSCELVDKYQPQLVYFDWWIRQIVFAPYLQRFAAYYYNQGIEGVINYKQDSFPNGTAVFDMERGQPSDILPQTWQACTSMSKNSWCHIADHDYKSFATLLHDLIDIVSKNGNLLLNIGPRSDGTIPEIEAGYLRDFGRWLAVNGEAIYGTRPFRIFGEGPTQHVGGQFQDAHQPAFTARDIRFTTKGNTLYTMVLGWPADGEVMIKTLGKASGFDLPPIQKIQVLGVDAPVTWVCSTEGLRVRLPNVPPVEPAFVLKIE